jgi:hypothetical protein
MARDQEAYRMLKRIVLAGATALMLITLGALPAFAAPATQTSRLAPQRVSLLNKVTLRGETSIDGPAMVSRVDTFEGKTTFTTVIGWTGTDTAHRLNLMKSAGDPSQGPLEFTNKLTLGQTSFVRPAVLEMPAAAGATIIAWTGNDSAHTLNVMWDAYGSKFKRTLQGETSIGAPALAFWSDGMVLAWTGTDANHSLNLLPISFATLHIGIKTVLRQFSSLTGPTLSVYSNASSSRLVLNWTTKTQHLNQAYSTNGVTFSNPIGAGGLPELSAKAPDSLYHQREGGPEYWQAWTGTNAAHSLNIQWTTHWPQWPDPTTTKTVLSDTAFGGPAIAFNSGFLIAWTGTDPAHTLNVAMWEGF